MRTNRVLLCCLIAPVAFSAAVSAFPERPSRQAVEPTAKLPAAQEILARYVEALGGKQAVQMPTSITTRSDVEMITRPDRHWVSGPRSPGYWAAIPSKTLHFSSVSYARLFKRLDKATVPGLGEFLVGYDGKTAWEASSYKRLAWVLEGDKLESIRRDSDIYYPLHEGDYFRVYETAGLEQFEGHQCYHIKGVTTWGKENDQFYDIKTGLLVGYQVSPDLPDNHVMNVEVFEDYKSFGGPLVPTRQTSRHGDRVERIVTITSVSYADIDDSVFDPPDSVKRLIEKKKKPAHD